MILKAKVNIVSEYLGRKDMERIGLKTVKHFDDAVEMAGIKRNGGKSIAVILEEPYTIPKMQTYH